MYGSGSGLPDDPRQSAKMKSAPRGSTCNEEAAASGWRLIFDGIAVRVAAVPPRTGEKMSIEYLEIASG
jgi:hypothetical protein